MAKKIKPIEELNPYGVAQALMRRGVSRDIAFKEQSVALKKAKRGKLKANMQELTKTIKEMNLPFEVLRPRIRKCFNSRLRASERVHNLNCELQLCRKANIKNEDVLNIMNVPDFGMRIANLQRAGIDLQKRPDVVCIVKARNFWEIINKIIEDKTKIK